MSEMNTATDAKAQISAAIEATGVAKSTDYDLEAILAETHTFDPALGYVQSVDTNDFWTSVERNAQ